MPIALVELKGDYYVVDGQHRLRVLIETEIQGYPCTVNYFIRHVRTADEMTEYFKNINKGVPVPEFIVNLNPDRRELMKDIKEWMRKRPGCKEVCQKRPLLNIDEFLNAFVKSNLYDSVVTVAEFVIVFEQLNAEMKYYYLGSETAWPMSNPGASKKKCADWNMYLGLDKNYPYFHQSYNLSQVFYQLELRRRQHS